MKTNAHTLGVLGVLALLVTLASPAFASDLLDQTTNLYKASTAKFEVQMIPFGLKLLGLLMGIQIGIDGMRIILKGSELNELLEKLAMTAVIFCVFAALIAGCQKYLPAILNLFISAGKTGTGLNDLTPSAIISQGVDVINTLHTSYYQNAGPLDKLNPIATLEVLVVELLVFAGFVVLAFQMVFTLVNAYFWMAVTPLLLGFGGLSFTRDMATSSMKGGIACGMKILVAYLLAGVAGELAPMLGESVATASPLHPQALYSALAAALIFAGLGWQLPKLAGDLMNGTASMSAGDALKGAAIAGAGVAGVAAAGAAAAAAGAKLGGSAAMEATGIAKALGAGMEAAGDQGKSGFSQMASAAGEVGKHGFGMMQAAIGDMVDGGKTSFASGVDSSVGGQVASSIQSSRGGSMAGVAPPPPSAGANGIPVPAPSAATAAPASSGSDGGGSSQAPVPSASPSASSMSPQPNQAAAPASSAGSIPVPGNASNASISGGDAAPPSAEKPYKAPLHDRMRDLAGYVPDDSHTVAVAANITHKSD